jgi:hypothetical protein
MDRVAPATLSCPPGGAAVGLTGVPGIDGMFGIDGTLGKLGMLGMLTPGISGIWRVDLFTVIVERPGASTTATANDPAIEYNLTSRWLGWRSARPQAG